MHVVHAVGYRSLEGRETPFQKEAEIRFCAEERQNVKMGLDLVHLSSVEFNNLLHTCVPTLGKQS